MAEHADEFDRWFKTERRRVLSAVVVVVAAIALVGCVGDGGTEIPTVAGDTVISSSTTHDLPADQSFDAREPVSIPYTVISEDLSEGVPYSVDYLGLPDGTVMLTFDLAESSSPDCQFLPLSDLVYDPGTERLYPLVLMAGQESLNQGTECDGDANEHRIVVAVPRPLLPDSFTLWIDANDPPACCTDRPIRVEDGVIVDLALEPVEGGVWRRAGSVIGGDTLPTVVWTGERVLVLNTENWGNDIIGELWDPRSNTATPIGDTGLIWRVNAASAWTGEELLVVGGSNGPGLDRQAVAYNPETDTWRDIASPPGVDRDGLPSFVGEGIWTGEELIVPAQSAAYDPESDSWRTIAEWPLERDRVAVVVGASDRIVVWGGCSGVGQCDETNSGLHGDGVVYDIAADSWTPLAAGPLPPAVHAVAGWTGEEVVVVVTLPNSGEPAAATLDPSTGEWRALSTPDIEARSDANLVIAQGKAVIWGGRSSTFAELRSGAVYDLGADEWIDLPEAPEAASLFSMASFDDGVYVSGTRTSAPQILSLDSP